MNLADAPDWYKFVWLKHQREVKKCSDDAIGRILDRYTENTGKRVYLPDCEGFVVPEPKGIDDDDEEGDEETTGRSRQQLEHSSVFFKAHMFPKAQGTSNEMEHKKRHPFWLSFSYYPFLRHGLFCS